MYKKSEAADLLANRIREVDYGVLKVFRVLGTLVQEEDRTEPLKLLVVNRDTVPVGVLPLRFSSNHAIGVRLPYVVMEVTPGEFKEILRSRMPLPHGWRVGSQLSGEGA